MDTYSVGDVALALGVSASTVRNWTEQIEFDPYLSNLATRKHEYTNAKERRYTQDDLYVLNTINVHKTRGNDWSDVAILLKDGLRETDLPETAALVLPETRAESFQLLTIARTQIVTLQKQVEDMEVRLQEKDKLLLEKSEMVKEEHKDLIEQIGVLKFILKQHGINPETGRKD